MVPRVTGDLGVMASVTALIGRTKLEVTLLFAVPSGVVTVTIPVAPPSTVAVILVD